MIRLLNIIPQSTMGLFDVTRPEQRASSTVRWWLLAIVVAGTLLRFWGLGDLGLHREDEDTSALPVLGLLETGISVYPSGMEYLRALAQTYMMAGSVALFGNSEWSLRLPSAVCGVLLILLCWQLGKRFLRPNWNLVFAATIAFLPALILASQTARMYIFMLASLAAFASLVFRWERTDSLWDLLWAMLVMLVALQFHTLAVFVAFLLFFPSLLHGDAKRFWLACLGTLLTVYAYDVVNHWLGQHFPQAPPPGFVEPPPPVGPTAASMVPQAPLWLAALAALAALAIAALAARTLKSPTLRSRWPAVTVGVLVFAGLAAQLLLSWHLSLLLLVAAMVVASRHDAKWRPLVLLLAVSSIAMGGLQLLRLQDAGIGSLKNIGGVMIGWPSVWAYVRLTDYSLFALLACAAALAAGLWWLAQRRQIPDFLLMLVLWGWIPVLAVGAFVWNPPPRYTLVTLLPMLLAAAAAAQWFSDWVGRRALGTAVLATVLIVNPVVFARTWNAGYEYHPDHVGAAQYVLSQHPGPKDIIVAEDAIVQKYYLPRVDYWLMARESIVSFVRLVDGVVRDTYTGSEILGTGAELQALIDRPDRGAIYIIGSGENQEDGRRQMRGAEMHARLTSGEFPVVYEGRDGLTKVWKIPAPAGD